MLNDPQSVTINGVVTTLPKTSNGPEQHVYTSPDGNTWMTTKQTRSKSRFRREVRLSQQKVAADPISGENRLLGTSVYIVIDEPIAGFTDVELGYLVDGLKAWLTSANYLKVLGGEF